MLDDANIKSTMTIALVVSKYNLLENLTSPTVQHQ